MMDDMQKLERLFQKLDGTLQKWESSREKSTIPQPDTIQLSLEPVELIELIQGILLRRCEQNAKKYLNASLNQGVSYGQRWATIAELMLIKEPGEKLRRRGKNNSEMLDYRLYLSLGDTPDQAAQKICKKYRFPTQAACNNWIRREITRFRQEKSSFFGYLKKPKKSIKNN